MTIVYFHDDDSNEDNSYHKIGVQLVNVDEKIRLQVERLVKAAVAEAQITESIFWRLDSLFHLRHKDSDTKKITKRLNDIDIILNDHEESINESARKHLVREYKDLPIYSPDVSHDELVADVDAKPMSSFVVPSVDGRDNPDDVIRAAPVDGRDVL